jgi:hypothetical protein
MSDALIIGVVVALAVPVSTIMTVILNQAFIFFTRREERRNDLADRAEVAKQVKIATDSAKEAALQASKSLNIVHAAVIEVGQKADASYKEANNANLKIQAVNDKLAVALNLPVDPITATTGANEGKATG